MEIGFAYELKTAFLIIITIIFGGLTALRFSYANIFSVTYSSRSFFSLKPTEDLNTGIRLLSTENLFFTLILAGILAFGISTLNYIVMDDPFQLVVLPNVVLTVLINWFLVLLMVGFFFLLKFFYIKLIGWLFNFPDTQSGHFQEYQSLSHAFYLFYHLLTAVFLISVLVLSTSFARGMAILLGIFLISRIFLLTVRLYAKSDFSIFYIFSYICTTELLPLALTIGFVIN